MSILDKKYYLRANISTSKIEGKTINFYNTDKNTSVLYLKLKYIDSCNLEKYFTSQMLDEYTIKLTVVKPKTLALVELNGVKENDMFKFELPSDFTDQVGKCVCEIMLSNATEDLTLEEFTYNVKESATTKFNAEIEKNPDLPILKQLIKEIKIINSNEDIRKENEINRVDEEKKRVIEHQSREQFLNSFEPKLQQMETDFNEAVANVTNGNESTTNSEVVLARKGKVSLREKIDEFDAQFNTIEQENKSNINIRSYESEQNAVVCFVFDDGQIQDLGLKTLFTELNVPLNLSVPTGLIDTTGYLTLNNLKELYSMGWGIVSHTHTHKALTGLTDIELENELRLSHEKLKEWGFDSDIITYPLGEINSIIAKKVRKYYQYGIHINIGNGINIPMDFNNMQLKRTSCVCHGGSNLEQCKQAVDNALLNNNLLIFEDHSWESGYVSGTGKDDLIALINYIKSKNIEILNIKDALIKKGNIIDVNEKTDVGYYRMSKTGEIWGKGTVFDNAKYTIGTSTTLSNSSPITDYPIDIVSEIWISNDVASIGNFPENLAGFLKTYRNKAINNSYQEYRIYNSNSVYSRYWNPNTSSWSEWQKLALDSSIIVREKINLSVTNSTPVTSFLSGVSYNTFTDSQASMAQFPESLGGLLTTFRLTKNNSNDMSSYQEYAISTSNKVYRRYWNYYKTVWGIWERLYFNSCIWNNAITMSNGYWIKLGNTELNNFVDFEKIYSTQGEQVTLIKNLWAKSEISIDSNNPTIIGTVGAINLLCYTDAINKSVYVKYSASGNNYLTYFRASYC
ncbi:polysaccharide deacetylase family protein [Terrisporobacter sp.]|uniref:polysaccharide deacetylase family protein n=1 Tax=Terrisporobacter sp. TaxID=1965305 RepID=UPI00289BB941|nr:polysaccharide deacetylase family protein [Terrisporobacter sp.]